mmetsp:Transcript_2915/g.13650  ORF Transcript_2915/g.13650 Transcript_2915/m.13650 type:complete len:109 (-) Transcript_2915:2788-3114(-)
MLLATIVKLFKGASGIGAPSVLFSGGLDELVAHILNWDERLRERERRITAPFLWVAGSMEHRVEMMVQEPDLTVREENLRRTLVEVWSGLRDPFSSLEDARECAIRGP